MEEDVIIGMISLLIVTIDKVTKNMEFEKFKEFKLKTESNSLLITDVNQDLILIIILSPEALDNNLVKEIESVGQEVTQQLRKLWVE